MQLKQSYVRLSSRTLQTRKLNIVAAGRECRENVNNYLQSLEYSGMRTMEDIIESNEKHADQELPPGKTCGFVSCPRSCVQTRLIRSVHDRSSEDQYKAAMEHLRYVAKDGVNATMERDSFDLLVILIDSFIAVLAAAADTVHVSHQSKILYCTFQVTNCLGIFDAFPLQRCHWDCSNTTAGNMDLHR